MKDLIITKWALEAGGGSFVAAFVLAYLDRGAEWFWAENIIPNIAGFLNITENEVLNTLEGLEASGLVESRIRYDNRQVWRLTDYDHE